MPIIQFEGTAFAAAEGESVLECLERHGVEVSSSCRSGVCQSCLMQCAEGDVPAVAAKGLKAALREQGYFLACACRPQTDLTVGRAGAAVQRTQARVHGVEWLNSTVVRLRLAPDAPIAYAAGQFANLVLPDGTLRSYSLASVPAIEAELEFHIAVLPNGRMSQWAGHTAAPGDPIEVQGPHGACCYVDGDAAQPLLLVGTGTGLAPLYGIARDAIHRGHTGPIHLFHGALHREGLYLVEPLRELARDAGNFHYHPCALNGDAQSGVHVGSIDAYVLDSFADLSGWRVFLCGHPDLVKLMQRKVFLAGASMGDIHADAFLPSATK